MRKRWIFLTVAAAVVVVGLTAGIAFAVGRGAAPTSPPAGSMMTAAASMHQGMVRVCDAMHDSPSMEQMHQQMLAKLRAQCDALHEQMDQMMSQMGSMMDGSGMMGESGIMGGSGSGMMVGGSHTSHHSGS